jgi:hypothetical protein
MSRLRSQEGSMIIEVMVAVLILVAGITTFVAVIPNMIRLTQTATRSEDASAAAEREIEKIRALPFSAIGLTSIPAGTSDTTSPAYWITGSNYRIANNWADTGSGIMSGTPSGGEPLWTSGGTIAPTGTVNIDGQTADVFRYVTEREESCPPNAGPLVNPLVTLLTPALSTLLATINTQLNTLLNNRLNARLDLFCLDNAPSHADSKRVIVAVRMRSTNNDAGAVRPVYMTTVVTDKARGVVAAP